VHVIAAMIWIGGLRPTPFHARTSAQNFVNAWTIRGSFTVPAHYIDPGQEALAARLTAAVIDISARQDLCIAGATSKLVCLDRDTRKPRPLPEPS